MPSTIQKIPEYIVKARKAHAVSKPARTWFPNRKQQETLLTIRQGNFQHHLQAHLQRI